MSKLLDFGSVILEYLRLRTTEPGFVGFLVPKADEELSRLAKTRPPLTIRMPKQFSIGSGVKKPQGYSKCPNS